MRRLDDVYGGVVVVMMISPSPPRSTRVKHIEHGQQRHYGRLIKYTLRASLVRSPIGQLVKVHNYYYC